MIINSLHIENFRCFPSLDIVFDKQLTVIVGVNGAGKTSVLDAVAVFLKSFTYSMGTKGNWFPPFLHLKDIAVAGLNNTIKYQITWDSSVATSPICDDKNLTSVSLEFAQKVSTRDILHLIDDDNKIFLFLTGIWDKASTISKHYGMPIACYYRSRQIATNRNNPNQTPNAYQNSFEPQIDFSTTLNWFIEKDADEARKQRKNREHRDPELQAVKAAVANALGNYDEPFVEGTPPKLYISPQGSNESYTIEQLSDGYRVMLAMVMDLARRMAVVNGRLPCFQEKSVLESPAVVLIDEVELHLHPAWQQTVLRTLMDIFPNVQFIVTTHSDQVLISIPARHIVMLKDGRVVPAPEESEGAESTRVLKRIFEVDPRPTNNEYVKMLDEYSDLVYAEQWDTERANSLRNKLEQYFGKNNEPRLKELELHIENSKWEKNL